MAPSSYLHRCLHHRDRQSAFSEPKTPPFIAFVVYRPLIGLHAPATGADGDHEATPPGNIITPSRDLTAGSVYTGPFLYQASYIPQACW